MGHSAYPPEGRRNKEIKVLQKIGYVLLIALATLGVLFIVLMLIPEEKEEASGRRYTAEEEEEDEEDSSEKEDRQDGKKEDREEKEAGEEKEEKESEEEAAEEISGAEEESGEEPAEEESTVLPVNIPAGALSKNTLSFKTVTLEGEPVDSSIFADYDLTICHFWGSYCQPCIMEMPDYAELYDALPDNINLIGILSDVYEGIDNNVDTAEDILRDSGASFTNLRLSDSLYTVSSWFNQVPSAFFVDSEGHVVGEVMNGKFIGDVVERLEDYLE